MFKEIFLELLEHPKVNPPLLDENQSHGLKTD
jgi:hypothetical protein